MDGSTRNSLRDSGTNSKSFQDSLEAHRPERGSATRSAFTCLGALTIPDALCLATLLRAADPRSEQVSIPLRIAQPTRQLKPRNVAFAANTRNQHHHAGIDLLKIKEQHNAPIRLRIAMDKPMRPQMRNERILQLYLTSN